MKLSVGSTFSMRAIQIKKYRSFSRAPGSAQHFQHYACLEFGTKGSSFSHDCFLIVPVALSDDLSVGTVGAAIASDHFIYVTTIAHTGNTFLVTNSHFNNRSGSPELPFPIAEIPLPSAPGAATSTTTESDAASSTTFQLEAWQTTAVETDSYHVEKLLGHSRDRV